MAPFYGSHHLLRPHGTMQGKARRAVVPLIRKSKKDLYLVPEVWRSIFWKVKRIYILSRSMEADILESKEDLYLVQKYGGRYV